MRRAGRQGDAAGGGGLARFTDIVDTIEQVLQRHDDARFDAHTVEGVLAADAWARDEAAGLLAASLGLLDEKQGALATAIAALSMLIGPIAAKLIDLWLAAHAPPPEEIEEPVRA